MRSSRPVIRPLSLAVSLWGVAACWQPIAASGQEHDHGAAAGAAEVERPRVFLDKSPRVVEYQLKRLDNQRLLLVQRKSDDVKYVPVFSAILTRVGMSPQFREEAAEALAKLQETDEVTVLLEAISGLDDEDFEERRTARQLSGMLVRVPRETLVEQQPKLIEATEADESLLRSAAFAGLVVAGQSDAALAGAKSSEAATLDFLKAVPLIPAAKDRAALRPHLAGWIDAESPADVRRAAIEAIAFVPNQRDETFRMIAPLISDPKLRPAVVRTLLKVPSKERDKAVCESLVSALVVYAETTPAAGRTSASFIDAMQLADQLLGRIPTERAKSARARLGAVTVRVVRIKTVEEEMRYDLPYFAVEAGRPVQVVLENHDLMPHNLVITVPGALKEVAQLGLAAGPNHGWKGLQYVPESDKVLFATQMVAADKQERLTFTAPTEPGEYPYVCTFPQHWYRMYGVMVVVEDLDAFMKNPVEPANPIGSNRSFVQSWKLDELKDELEAGMRGRSAEIGQKLFVEASCSGCHKAEGVGGVIGPDLTDLFTRWKGDRVGVLREILDPSHKVDAKYAMQRILTVDGRTITGVLLKEDDDNVTLLSNPEAKEPTVIPQDDIDAMVPSSVSMMPKALLDQYTKDEIFEIMSYLESIDPKSGSR